MATQAGVRMAAQHNANARKPLVEQFKTAVHG